MDRKKKARELLKRFKGSSYTYGEDALTCIGEDAASLGRRAVLVHSGFSGSRAYIQTIESSLEEGSVELIGLIPGGRPNAPLEDLARVTDALIRADPDVIITFGGGSNIDLVKAAGVMRTLGGSIEDYFGVGKVTEALEASGKVLIPHLAVQTAAGSAAHLTKYSNITDLESGQKKLIVDEAIVPNRAYFDYGVTRGAPAALTMDGGLDGIAHALEVVYGAVGKESYPLCLEIAKTAIGLVIEYLPRAVNDPLDYDAREALGLATDLGGYAIMVGGTNGGHLTSFSLVDLLSHGRACALMNPYYTVFFAPAIEECLREIGRLYGEYHYSQADFDGLNGTDLGKTVARAMFALSEEIGFPLTLNDVEGYDRRYISRALEAAKNPQLRMKLANMPVPLEPDGIDEYMGSVLRAAESGDLSLIRTK